MRNQTVLLTVLFAVVVAYISACEDTGKPKGSPNPKFFDVAVSDSIVNDAKRLFPEGSSPHVSVTPSVDVLLKLETASNLTFTFVWEGAGNRNQFGYFLYNPAATSAPTRVMIFPDCTWVKEGGCMYTGSSVQVGPIAAGSQVGFFIKSDGYTDSNGAIYYSVHNTSTPVKNADGYRHTAWVGTSGVILIGFEDLKNLGDKDYNDVMFFVTVTGQYNDDDVPKYENGTLQVCSDAEITTYTEYQCTQYASLTARNPSSCIGYLRVPEGWTLAPDSAETISAIDTATKAGVSFGSTCVVLASGRGVNVNTLATCGTDLIKNFTKDAGCFNVDCAYTMLIKGQALSQCSGSQSLTCNPEINSNLLSKFPTTQVNIPLYPIEYNIYLNNLIGNAATIDLPVVLRVPSTPKVDLMVLIDTNGLSSSTYLSTIRAQINTLFSSLNSRSYNPLMGIATLDSTGTVNLLTTLSSSTTTISNALNSISTSSASVTNSKVTQALVNSFYGAKSNIGWRQTGTYNAVLVITAKNFATGVSNADLNSASLTSRVFPVFLSTSAVTTSYSTLAASQAFAYADSITDTYSNIATKALTIIDAFVKTVKFDTALDLTPAGFVSALPAISTNVNFNQTLTRTIVMKYPSGSPNVSPVPFEVDVNVWGYGTLTTWVSVNRAPTVVAKPTITLNEDSSASFEVAAQDADNNVLNVVYLSVSPSTQQSYFKTSAGAALVFNTASYTDFTGIYQPATNYYGTTTLSFLVRDGCVNSTVGTLAFTVANVNDPPVARPIALTINEDTNAVIYFNSSYISDIDNVFTELSVFVQSFPANGAASLAIGAAGGASWTQLTSSATAPTAVTNKYLRYTPAANFHGTITFNYYVQDPSLSTSSSMITITVLPVNDPPTSSDLTVRTNEDVPVTFTSTGQDIDNDTPLYYEVVTVPTVGTAVRTLGGAALTPGMRFSATPADWRITYTPPANTYSASTPLTTFKFRVNDNNGGISPEYTVRIYVDPINDGPTAADFGVTTPEDTPVAVTFTSYINDVDNDVTTLKVYIKSPPMTTLGRLVEGATQVTTNNYLLTNQTLNFVPSSNQNGAVTFTYYVKDPSGLTSADATVTVNVTPMNDPPVISVPTTTFVSKVSGSVPVTISMTDPDWGTSEELTLSITSNNLGSLVPNLSVTSGQTTGVTVASGALTNLATSWTNTVDGSARVTILTWNPTTSSLQPGTKGNFTVRATDKEGATSNSVVITLAIADNTPPTVTTPNTPVIAEDSSATDIKLFGTDADIAHVDKLKLTISQLPANGVLRHNDIAITTAGYELTTTGDSTGTWAFVDYKPNSNFFGSDSYKFFATDLAGASSNVATGQITITSVNDSPVGGNVTVRGNEDTVIPITTIDATDVDGDILTLNIVTMPGSYSIFTTGAGAAVTGTTTIQKTSATSWEFSYKAPANAHSNPTGSVYTSFTYKITDDNGGASPVYTVFVIVDPVNDAPTAEDFAVSTPEDTNVVINFATHVADPDNDTPLTITIKSLPSLGTLYSGTDGLTFPTAVNAAGITVPQQKLQFRPQLNVYGSTSFTYIVSDPSGAVSSVATVSITVTPVNDPPLSQNVVLRTLEDTILNFTLTGSDVEGDDLTFVVVSVPATGDLTRASDDFYIRSAAVPFSMDNPSFSYIPPQNFFTTTTPLTFNFYVFDGTDRSVLTYTVSIYVDSVNDAPTSEDIFVTTKEDTPVSFNLAALDAEDPSESLVAVVTAVLDGEARGTFYTSSNRAIPIVTGLVLTNPRTVYFVPAANAYSNPSTAPLGTLKFQVRDTEGLVSMAEYNALVYVTPVNDPAVYNGASVVTIDEDASVDLALMNQVTDIDDTVNSGMTVLITAITGKGTFSECAEDVNDCLRTALTVGHELANPEWRFNFVPLKDDNGDNYATISFTINDGHENSIAYTITINVRPVNDPPVVNPFYNVIPGRVDMDEDTVLEISWNVTDIDSPITSLTTHVLSQLPNNGRLYACNVQEDGSCARGDELFVPGQIAVTDAATATWRVLFVPAENDFDARNFASWNIAGEDDQNLRSVTVRAVIRVLPINDAPVITAKDSYTVTRDTAAETKFLFSDVSINDIDAFKKPITFVIKLLSENSGRLEAHGSNTDLAFGGKKPRCVLSEDKTEVVCNDPQTDLNVWISSAIAYYPNVDNAGEFKVLLSVDDLGNTDKLQRPLTANKTITVFVNEDTGLLPDTPGDSTGIAVGLSVGGAAAIAGIAVLIAKLRKRNAVVDNYFENLADNVQTGSTNPMYQAAYSDAANPLYKAKN